MGYRAAALLMLLLAPSRPTAAQQGAATVLVVRQGGHEIGREEFTLASGRARGAAGSTIAATAKYPPTAPTTRLAAVLERTPDKALALHRAILAEVEKMDDPGYLTAEELTAAKAEVEVAQLYEREQASEWAHTVGFWWAGPGLEYYLGYVDGMQEVTETDIAEFARTYMIGKPHVSGVLIDPAARAEVGLTADDLLAQEVVQ